MTVNAVGPPSLAWFRYEAAGADVRLIVTFTDPFTEVAAVLAVAAGFGALAFWLRQPLIIAFIFVGVLLGPAGLDWVRAYDQVDLFAKLGIGLLLFVVGLKLDPHLIRSVGLVAMVTGLGQMVMTAVLGYGVALALGYDINNCFLCSGGPDLLQHRHHCQVVVGQARNRCASRAYRAWHSDHARHCRRYIDDWRDRLWRGDSGRTFW